MSNHNVGNHHVQKLDNHDQTIFYLVAPQLVHHVRELEHSARRVDCHQHISPSPEHHIRLKRVKAFQAKILNYSRISLRNVLILNLIREGKLNIIEKLHQNCGRFKKSHLRVVRMLVISSSSLSLLLC